MIIQILVLYLVFQMSLYITAYVQSKGYSKELSYVFFIFSFVISPLGTYIIAWLLEDIDAKQEFEKYKKERDKRIKEYEREKKKKEDKLREVQLKSINEIMK